MPAGQSVVAAAAVAKAGSVRELGGIDTLVVAVLEREMREERIHGSRSAS